MLSDTAYTLINVGSMIVFYVGGYLTGKTSGFREALNKHYDNWIEILDLAEKNSKCRVCYVSDDEKKHPFCLYCGFNTLREMKMIIPEWVWLKGAKEYQWAMHFESIYLKHHDHHKCWSHPESINKIMIEKNGENKSE